MVRRDRTARYSAAVAPCGPAQRHNFPPPTTPRDRKRRLDRNRLHRVPDEPGIRPKRFVLAADLAPALEPCRERRPEWVLLVEKTSAKNMKAFLRGLSSFKIRVIVTEFQPGRLRSYGKSVKSS